MITFGEQFKHNPVKARIPKRYSKLTESDIEKIEESMAKVDWCLSSRANEYVAKQTGFSQTLIKEVCSPLTKRKFCLR